jgi:ABC-2 type transport system ATP-binding protein
MAAIEVRDLEKHYGSVRAVDGASFQVDEGTVFALLGPNGAGKTTTVEILEGYRDATAGHVEVLGFDPAAGDSTYRDHIGIVLQETGIDPTLTVREALVLYRRYYSRHRDTGELIDLVGLDEKADARIKTLSGGQRRRLDLALALVGDPDLVFLDEPTTGFDPSARRRAWGLVENLASLGKTILLTTHYLDEAQHLADHIAVMGAGKIIAEGTPDTLAAGTVETTITFVAPAATSITDLPTLSSPPRADGDRWEVVTGRPTSDLHALTSWAVGRGIDLDRLQVIRPSLEDVYLDIIGDDES